jgi:uncharacterized protein YjiK
MRLAFLLLSFAFLISLLFGRWRTDLVSDHNGQGSEAVVITSSASPTYDWQRASHVMTLASALVEISGLDWQDDYLIANNDEEGRVFFLDPTTGSIDHLRGFGKHGDYEGVATLPSGMATVRSDGKVYIIQQEAVSSYKTALKKKDNIEGLTYESSNHQLLLASKNSQTVNQRFIYAFDLKSKILIQDPYLTIEIKDLIDLVESTEESETRTHELHRRCQQFAPSGITIDKQAGDFYIISAKGSLLVIIGSDHKPREIVFLDDKILPQPEGITIDPDRRIYISTEGQSSQGKIFRFDRL